MKFRFLWASLSMAVNTLKLRKFGEKTLRNDLENLAKSSSNDSNRKHLGTALLLKNEYKKL